jgi:hypothetical protein
VKGEKTMANKTYRSEDHVLSEVEIPRRAESVWCDRCGSGYALSSDGTRHEHADRHERLIGTPHCWEDQEDPEKIRSCGADYVRRVWKWTDRSLVCSCGGEVRQQHDGNGIPCGQMCDARFLATYRQDRYDVRDYGETLEPEN